MGNSDSWCTPRPVSDRLVDFFAGPVGVDPCSNEVSIIQAHVAYTFGGLHLPWGGLPGVPDTAYENYPYSQGDEWTNKMLRELAAGRVDEHVRLVMAATSTTWWRRQCLKPKRNPRILFTKRLAFITPFQNGKTEKGEKTSSARFEPALIYYGPRAKRFERVFAGITSWTSWGR